MSIEITVTGCRMETLNEQNDVIKCRLWTRRHIYRMETLNEENDVIKCRLWTRRTISLNEDFELAEQYKFWTGENKLRMYATNKQKHTLISTKERSQMHQIVQRLQLGSINIFSCKSVTTNWTDSVQEDTKSMFSTRLNPRAATWTSYDAIDKALSIYF